MNGEKKKLLIIAGAIVGIVVLTIIILLVFHAVTNKKMTYKKVEEKVLTAAKKYYKENNKSLPELNKKVTINDSTLTAAGYLKNMSDLTSKLDATCTAEVVVTNKENKYRYTVLLNCGEKYSTKTLVSKLKSKGTVTSGIGLYDLNGELVYRGENPNNYIKISNKMYRIVKITDDKALLIYNEKTSPVAWDDRFNTERNFYDGINDYTISRIRDHINYLNLVKDEDKDLLELQTLYTGGRNISDIYNDGSIEKSNIYDNQVYGLLPLYDYINASIDNNCMSAETESCTNYNYLSKYEYNWWTITPDATNTYKVFRVDDEGAIDLVRCNAHAYTRPTIMLAADVLYASGDGTEKNPYMVK